MSKNKQKGPQKAAATAETQHSLSKRVEDFYDKNYKKLAIVPTIIGIIAVLYLLGNYLTTGEIMNRGVSLKGGTTVTVNLDNELDVKALEQSLLQSYPGDEFNIRVLRKQGQVNSIVIETNLLEDRATGIIPIFEQVTGKTIQKDHYNIESIGSSLSESFFQEMMMILLIAFALMAIVVFIYFRSPVPSAYVVLCAFFDMVITIAIIDLMGTRVTTAGVASFLMLINLSISTDSLLTARIIRRESGVSPHAATVDAFKTGITITLTTAAGILVAFILSSSPDIKQIMLILLVGLAVDLVVTWLQNASLCRWYVEATGK
jgi:preprotein translocase subunit SecF